MSWWKRPRFKPTPSPFIVEPEAGEFVLCDCCGTKTQKIWGWVHQGDATLLCYYMRWSEGHPESGADINLQIGKWGKDAEPADRFCVSLNLFLQDNQKPAFMVVDARPDFFGEGKSALNGLLRSDVIDTPLAAAVFAAIDAIWCQDERIPFHEA